MSILLEWWNGGGRRVGDGDRGTTMTKPASGRVTACVWRVWGRISLLVVR